MDNKALKNHLLKLLKQEFISPGDITDLQTLYPSFTAFDDDYNTLTPIDRVRVVRTILDTLNGDIKESSNKHITLIHSFVNNLGEIPVLSMSNVKYNMEILIRYMDLIKKDGAVIFEENEWHHMPPTLRKYAGQSIMNILGDITNISSLIHDLGKRCYPVISGTKTQATYNKYMKRVKSLSLRHELDTRVVGKDEHLMYIGRYFLMYTTSEGVPVLRTLIFPENSELKFPIAKASDIKNIKSVVDDCISNITHHYADRTDIIEITNTAILNLKNNPSSVEVDTNDVGRVLLDVINISDNINNMCLITLDEIVDFLAKSMRYRYKTK